MNQSKAPIPITDSNNVAKGFKKEEVLNALNDLIQINIDGEKGYLAAAETAENERLTRSFRDIAAARQRFAGELLTLVESMGGEPEDSGSLKGTLHRNWLKLKASVTNGDEAMLEECIRGEESALETYEAALENGLPYYDMPAQNTLNHQMSYIRTSLESLRELEEIFD